MTTQSLQITFIGHTTVLIEMDGFRILTDPLLRNRVSILRRTSPSIYADLYKDIDAVLISHLHIDHLDAPSLQLLNKDATLYIPSGSSRFVNSLGFARTHELKVYDTATFGAITIHSTYAKHRHWRYPLGPTADPMGFLISGQYNIYFTGDTDLFPGMSRLSENLDVALLPVWGWGPTISKGHLDPKRAVEALKMLNPRTAIPIHWGTMHPTGIGWLKRGFLSEPPIEFKRLALESAPSVSVRIVPPGGAVTFDGANLNVDV